MPDNMESRILDYIPDGKSQHMSNNMFLSCVLYTFTGPDTDRRHAAVFQECQAHLTSSKMWQTNADKIFQHMPEHVSD